MVIRMLRGIRVLPFLTAAVAFFFSFSLCGEEISAVPGKYSHEIEQTSLRYGINPRFVQSLIWRESRFDASITGAAGEIGLMQVKIETIRDWAKEHNRPAPFRDQVYGVELNLEIGVWRLDQALKNWDGYPDQIRLALYEYNAGRTALLRHLAHYDGDVALLVRNFRSARYADEIIAKFLEYSCMDAEPCDMALNP